MDCHEDVCRDTIPLPVSSSDAQLECPASRSELGRAAWVLMHTTAAYYPEVPSSQQQQTFLELYQRIANTYPCKECAGFFREAVEAEPPRCGVFRVASRKELSIWVCQLHNKVNKMLGRGNFPCTMEALDRRWRKGPPECYGTLNFEEDITYS